MPSCLTFVLVPDSVLSVRDDIEVLAEAASQAALSMTGPLFPLGQMVATPGAIEVMERLGIIPLALLSRHVSGDWGDIDPEDKGLNEAGPRDRRTHLLRLRPRERRLWVITEADRSATTILRPEDY